MAISRKLIFHLLCQIIQHRLFGMVLTCIIEYLGFGNYPFYITFFITLLINNVIRYVLKKTKRLFKRYILGREDDETPTPEVDTLSTEPAIESYRYYHRYTHLGAHRGIFWGPKYLEDSYFPTLYSRLYQHDFFMELIIEEDAIDIAMEEMNSIIF